MSKLILHADDERQIRELFREALLDEGHRVTSVASASEALKALASEAPDLIISASTSPTVTSRTPTRQPGS